MEGGEGHVRGLVQLPAPFCVLVHRQGPAFLSESGKLTYVINARRMILREVFTWRNDDLLIPTSWHGAA